MAVLGFDAAPFLIHPSPERVGYEAVIILCF